MALPKPMVEPAMAPRCANAPAPNTTGTAGRCRRIPSYDPQSVVLSTGSIELDFVIHLMPGDADASQLLAHPQMFRMHGIRGQYFPGFELAVQDDVTGISPRR